MNVRDQKPKQSGSTGDERSPDPAHSPIVDQKTMRPVSGWNVWKRATPRRSWQFVKPADTYTEARRICEAVRSDGYEARVDFTRRWGV